MSAQWVPDILGDPYEQHTIDLGEDAEGPLVATLVRRSPGRVAALAQPLHAVDVLYVHGWSDYFFQTELAEFWNHLGARFFALDLRKYGRSLRDGQTPGDIGDLRDYDVEIDAARAVIAETGGEGRALVVMAHSTGGLITSLWASRHPGVASALVLNSPWLEFQSGSLGRQALEPLVLARAAFRPDGQHPDVDRGFYTRAQTEIGALPRPGYREEWRPARGFHTHPGWLGAVLAGHDRVAAGIDVGCPVLVLISARSSVPLVWSDDMTSTDSVLVVDDIARAASRIGPQVTIARIDGAIHDIVLSRPHVRVAAELVLHDWLMKGVMRG